MSSRPSLRAAALAAGAAVGALLLAGPVHAQTVRMFDDAPSIETLRQILIPESKPGGLSRRIEIPRRDAVAGPSMIRPTSGESGGPAAGAPANPPASEMAASPAPAAAETPAATAPAPTAAPSSAEIAPAAPAPTDRHRVAASAPTPESARPMQKAALPEAAPAAKSAVADVVGFRINFDLNSSMIPPAYETYVDRIGVLMQQEPSLSLLIEGHTDALGSDAYNMQLSERRAIAVARYLVVRHGIAPERLQVAGKGKSEPLLEDPYDPRNRRVQFIRTE
jgi:outer membrane protein OmpA-like peptidoglycan-associated protein